MSEPEYLINEDNLLLLAMQADTAPAACARAEMIAIVKAWKRGRLLSQAETPTLRKLYGASARCRVMPPAWQSPWGVAEMFLKTGGDDRRCPQCMRFGAKHYARKITW